MEVQEEECFQDLVSFNSAMTSHEKWNFVSVLCEAQMKVSQLTTVPTYPNSYISALA